MKYRTRNEISQTILKEVKHRPLTITQICTNVGIRYGLAKTLIAKLLEKDSIKTKEMRTFRNNKVKTHYLIQHSIPSAPTSEIATKGDKEGHGP